MTRFLILAAAAALAVSACDNRDSRTPNTTNPATPSPSSSAPASSAAPPVTSAMSASTTPASSVAASAAARDPATFVDKAGRAGAFEIEASKLAQNSASSGEVKSFATRMVDDHTRVAGELKQAAGGLMVPEQPDAAQRAKIDALAKSSGAEFDKTYANEVGVAAHEEAVALFDEYAKNGTDANLKAFADKSLPGLRDHLAMAKQLAGALVAAK